MCVRLGAAVGMAATLLFAAGCAGPAGKETATMVSRTSSGSSLSHHALEYIEAGPALRSLATAFVRATCSYDARREHRAKGTAKVRGKEFGLAGTGKVKFLLKKGTRTIQSKTDTLNKKGIASVAFTGVKKKGKYKIVAKFGGDKALKASSGSDTFTV